MSPFRPLSIYPFVVLQHESSAAHHPCQYARATIREPPTPTPLTHSDPWSKYEDQLAKGDSRAVAALAANLGQACAAANIDRLRERRGEGLSDTQLASYDA